MASANRPFLTSAYISLALRLQENVGDLSAETARIKLIEALSNQELTPLTEVGRRNNASDQQVIQTIHDHSMALGAACGMEESAHVESGPLQLVESAAATETIVLREAKADYEIKLIAPGKGSSAFYPAEVLRRDGPKVFKVGTHVYLNHPTAAEEAARPEGDIRNLAGVLQTAAVYHESHAKGPGLYARMKVFADHAQAVEEKAAHVGMSIRANGVAEAKTKRDGLPVLKELTSAESVDVVTKAGAGGMILQESQVLRESQEVQESQEGSMSEDEVTKLVESAVTKAVQATVASTAESVRALNVRALRGDAREEGARLMESSALPPVSKLRVIEACLDRLPEKDGALDVVKFAEILANEAKREGAYLATLQPMLGRVQGLGPSSTPESDPVKLAEARKREEAERVELREAAEGVFMRIMGNKDAAKAAAAKGVA